MPSLAGGLGHGLRAVTPTIFAGHPAGCFQLGAFCMLMLCGSFGSLPYIYRERRAIDMEYGELTTRWSYSHVRSPPLAEAAAPPEVVAQLAKKPPEQQLSPKSLSYPPPELV